VASLPERRRVTDEALKAASALLPAWPVAWPAELASAFPALATRYRIAVAALDDARTVAALDDASALFLAAMGDVARWIKLGGAGGVPAHARRSPTPAPGKRESAGERQPEAPRTVASQGARRA
jgi:hypothetical protein